jgi:nicotinamide phosphoribosyltransferase
MQRNVSSFRDLIKFPKGDSGKLSLPGEFAIGKSKEGPLTVHPKESPEGQKLIKQVKNVLQVIYDCGPVQNYQWESFDALRMRLKTQWTSLPKQADPISDALYEKITHCVSEQVMRNQKAYNS